jgi:hypothetical protein
MWTRTSPEPIQHTHRNKLSNFSCENHYNTFTERKKHIESFAVFHPLLDRLL